MQERKSNDYAKTISKRVGELINLSGLGRETGQKIVVDVKGYMKVEYKRKHKLMKDMEACYFGG